MRLHKIYLLLTVILFIIEVLIAVFLNDRFVRPYVGDVLVVILIYCFVKTFVDTPLIPTAIGVLLFAFLIEVMQYIHIVDRLGLGNQAVARTVMGTSFEWMDLVAYTIGIVIVIFIEKIRK